MHLVNTLFVTSAVVVALGSLAPAPLRGAPEPSGIVERFLDSAHPPLDRYVALRHLEASTRGGAMRATLDVRTELGPDHAFSYQVLREDGSDLIRSHVLRKALEEERRARQDRDVATAELTPANYIFGNQDHVDGFVRIALIPRRASRMLVEGNLFVTGRDADLVRVEGRLSKRPSFWTRSVQVSREYARIEGVRVPTAMRSTADVRIVGAATFAMTYDYQSVNGHAVTATTRPTHD